MLAERAGPVLYVSGEESPAQIRLRAERMGEAARNMEPFDEAYARTDWSRFSDLPLFRMANRMNAYNTYLLMEREAK